MPDLDTLLKDTLLLTAAPGATYQSFEGGGGAQAQAAAGPSAGSVWNWTHNLGTPGRVRNVTHRVRETPWFPAQTLTVLDELVWSPIEITYKGTALKLELTREFLLRRYETPGGSVAKKTTFWIPTDLDRSLMLVFGFQVNLRAPAGTLALEPIPKDVLCSDGFMPVKKPTAPPKPPVMKVKRTETGTLSLSPLRVLVCAEFVCCKERNDYTPHGLAATSRFRPHLMFMSNRPLERMAARIHVRRPPMSSMAHPSPPPPPPSGDIPPTTPTDPGHGHHHGVHAQALPGDRPEDQDEMLHEMATGMWSDANDGLLSWKNLFNPNIPPLWHKMFSRFKTNLRAGAGYLMASPQIAGGPGFNVDVFDRDHYQRWQEPLQERQGYFDNIHVAPPMRAPRSIREFFKNASQDMRLDNIAMAPFCIHDCLHMHWRWLPTGKDETHLWGWDHEKPYAVAGVPHIPAHQHLRVEVDAPHAFTYAVQADSCLEAGRWQYVMHEGMAFGNSAANESLAQLMHAGIPLLQGFPTVAYKSWSMFYWTLRYQCSITSLHPRERLLEDGAQSQSVPDPAPSKAS